MNLASITNPKVKSAQRDEEGYVINPGDWSRELAISLERSTHIKYFKSQRSV